MTLSASLKNEKIGLIRTPAAPSKGGRRSREEVYLVQRMTFSPLAVREMFLAQTGRSGGGLGRGGGAEEEAQSDGEMEEEEVMEVTEVDVMMDVGEVWEIMEEVEGFKEVTGGEVEEVVGVCSTSSLLLLFFLSSSTSSSSSSSSSSSFSSVRGNEPSHNALL